jgi:hypothetical protein
MRAYLFILLLFPFIGLSQESKKFVAKGLFSGKGTLAIGLPTAYSGTNMYISGNLEYYLEENISFRGGIWIFLGTSGAEDLFAKNSTLFTGFYYHFKTKNNIDPFVGLEPGISWTQLKKPDDSSSYPNNISSYPQSISPVVSVAAGINYYATNWVHLFVEAKFVHGVHTSDIPSVSLNEFRIAFGFGFNIWTMKKKI